MALFGEKYGDSVRVLSMGAFSKELCGGTHVKRTGDIGTFKIISESGIAAGVRRIEAVTGDEALAVFQRYEMTLNSVLKHFKVTEDRLHSRLSALDQERKALEKQIDQLKAQAAAGKADQLVSSAKQIGEVKVLIAELDGVDAKTLRETVEKLRDKLGNSAVMIATKDGDKVSFVAAVAKPVSGKLPAGELVSFVAGKLGGRGGGKPELAQGGAPDVAGLAAALSAAQDFVAGKLA
jgi:alanyl-tRNA synthetase